MTHPTFVSVVVHARNSAPELAAWLPTLAAYLRTRFAIFEIVVVDDASTDDTAAVVERLAQEVDAPLTLVRMSRPHGIDRAMLAGLAQTTGDWVVEIDKVPPGHPTELIGELWDTASQGYDVVAATPGASSQAAGWFYSLVNRASYLDEPLTTERTRVVSRRALNAMLDLAERTEQRRARYSLTGLPKSTVDFSPSRDVRRDQGGARLSTAMDILIAHSDIGPRLAQLLALVFGAVSLLSVVYVVVANLVVDVVVEGWTTVMVLVSTGLAGLFLTLGIIGEYLARILREIRARPLYSVESTVTHLSPSAAVDEEDVVTDGDRKR